MVVKILTLKQEKYVLNLINGMSQREAYKNAYDAKNMKDETIDSKASELFSRDKVRARYNELLEEAKNKAIMSSLDRQKWLTDVINGTKESNMTEKLKALDLLNKMTGEYVERVMNITPPTIEDDIL